MPRVLMVLLCCAAAVAPASGQSSSADEATIREVVKQYVDARDRRDAAAIAAVFTADADQFTTSGEWRKGREIIVSGGLASSERNPGARSITVETVRFIAPGVAIADGGYQIRGAGGEPPRPMWATIVLTRTPGGWRIAAIRNARPTALPR